MFNLIIVVIIGVIIGAILSSIYHNNILSQVVYEMINSDIDVNDVTFEAENIIDEDV